MAVAVEVPVAVATAPAAAVAAHLNVERLDIPVEGVPHGAVSLFELFIAVFSLGFMRGYFRPLVRTRR